MDGGDRGVYSSCPPRLSSCGKQGREALGLGAREQLLALGLGARADGSSADQAMAGADMWGGGSMCPGGNGAGSSLCDTQTCCLGPSVKEGFESIRAWMAVEVLCAQEMTLRGAEGDLDQGRNSEGS